MTRLLAIGMITATLGCSEANPFVANESTGTTDATTTMSTTTMSMTTTEPTSTTTMSTTTGPTTTEPTTETTDDPTTGTVDTSTGEAQCEAGASRCVPEPPVGWSLPSAVRYSDGGGRDPGCAAPYDVAGTVAYADLAAGPHDCACDCGDAMNVGCSDVTLTGDDSANCNSPLGSVMVGEDCTALPTALEIPGTSSWRATASVTGGSCFAETTNTIGPAVFEDRLTICLPARPSAGECADGETCTPLPGDEHDGRICIWQAGDVECPDDTWTDGSLVYQDFDDTRGCTTCTCGDPEGECEGSVGIGTTANCVGGQAVASVTVGGACQEGGSGSIAQGASISGSLEPVNLSCVASGGTQSGSISTDEPVTLCCLPPD